jgi:hypothetical protein
MTFKNANFHAWQSSKINNQKKDPSERQSGISLFCFFTSITVIHQILGKTKFFLKYKLLKYLLLKKLKFNSVQSYTISLLLIGYRPLPALPK